MRHRTSAVLGSALAVLIALPSASRSESVSDPAQEVPEGTRTEAPPPRIAGEGTVEVVVMGMLHGEHAKSRNYGVARIQEMIRNIDPDYVLTEIPPDRFERALKEFRTDGVVMEPRVGRFPEYVDALFPLTREMDFEIVPCAAWTKPIADARSAKLAELKTRKPVEYAEVEAAWKRMEEEIRRNGLGGHPRTIHTEQYDDINRRGMEPYARLLDDELGDGGWTAINEAHFALIRRAIEARRGTGGKRFLITFGAGHKYWILDSLKGMEGVVVRNPLEFDPQVDRSGAKDSSD